MTVANSDYASTALTLQIGDTALVTCNFGYLGGGNATCGSDVTFNSLTCGNKVLENNSAINRVNNSFSFIYLFRISSQVLAEDQQHSRWLRSSSRR